MQPNSPQSPTPEPQPTQPTPPAMPPASATTSFQDAAPTASPIAVRPPQPIPTSSGVVVATYEADPPGKKPVFKPGGKARRGLHLSKKIVIPMAVLIVLLGGSAAAYFGYYMNPSVVWKQSLGHMNSGYNKLVSYLNTTSSTHYKGATETGSFKVTSGDTNYDGSLSANADNKNATVSAKVDLGVTKLDLEARSVTPAGASQPDVYLQLSGIKQLDSSLGGELGPQIDSLDGEWILVDHNLIADFESAELKAELSQDTPSQLTWTEINSFLQAAGRVNQQYVFTTNKSTAVTTVLKTYGHETVDGHSTIHYKVGFVPAHVKAYVTAMCAALQQSSLGSYIKQQTGQDVGTTATCKDLESSASQIKSSNTIDVWADTKTRMLYKVRVSDPSNAAQNFVDIGLNYKGGTSYPFFFSGQDKTGGTTDIFSVTASLDSKTNAIALSVDATEKGGSAPFSLTGNFNLQPTNTAVNVTAPAGAVPLATVLNTFGLGQYTTTLQSLGTSSQTISKPLTQVPVGLLTNAVL